MCSAFLYLCFVVHTVSSSAWCGFPFTTPDRLDSQGGYAVGSPSTIWSVQVHFLETASFLFYTHLFWLIFISRISALTAQSVSTCQGYWMRTGSSPGQSPLCIQMHIHIHFILHDCLAVKRGSCARSENHEGFCRKVLSLKAMAEMPQFIHQRANQS